MHPDAILAELDAMSRRIFDLRLILAGQRGGCATHNRSANLRVLMQLVADAYHIPCEWMTVHLREAHQVWPRQVAMWLAREILRYSLIEIGRAFRRDHGTVIHACRAVRARLATDPRDAAFVTVLRAELEARFPRSHSDNSATPPDLSPL